MGSYLGTSISWPLAAAGSLVSDQANIRQSLEALFSTDFGTNVFDPRYGTKLRSLVFEPNLDVLRAVIVNDLTAAIRAYEQRVSVESISLQSVTFERCDIMCILRLKSLNELFSFVYPFYRQLN